LRRLSIAPIFLLIVSVATEASSLLPWMVLPPTPTLPKMEQTGFAPVNGIRLWYAEIGHGAPVILVHGGLANSDYWGLQVRALAPSYRVIVLDSRGHGRSSRSSAPIGYDLMASDVIALMDYLHIGKAAIVGWSDGAIIGLDLAIHHPERIARVYAFAANSNPQGVKDVNQSPVFMSYIARAANEYARLSPTPKQYQEFLADIEHMWATQPNFTAAQLSAIAVPVWIVDGDHDEAIKRENTDQMASLIPGAGELILPAVSHFAFLQDPVMFNESLLHFLAPEDNRTDPVSPTVAPSASNEDVNQSGRGDDSGIAGSLAGPFGNPPAQAPPDVECIKVLDAASGAIVARGVCSGIYQSFRVPLAPGKYVVEFGGSSEAKNGVAVFRPYREVIEIKRHTWISISSPVPPNPIQ
jgi:pimeloyl-ACP methyl ester carboxylesterase